MQKSTSPFLLLSLFIAAVFLLSTPANAQTIVNCGETFTDPGGVSGNYPNGANVTYQICPTNPGDAVRVTFSEFFVESNWDRLNAFNGATTGAPSLGSFSGNLDNNLPGGTNGLISTDTSGCLSFRFTSDGSGNYKGWVAQVSCAPQCKMPKNLAAGNITPHTANLSWSSPGAGATPQSYLYEIRTTGTPGSGATGLVTSGSVNAPTTTKLISGLEGNTTYKAYLRSTCGGIDTSIWTSATTFTTKPGCGSTFTDPGGASGNYPNGKDSISVICPDNPGDAVVVTFSMFRTQSVLDKLTIYNGNSINATLIGTYSGAGLLFAPGGGEITANNASGCLTFHFSSDAANNDQGWMATVTCIPAPTCVRPSGITLSKIGSDTAVLKWVSPNFTTPVNYSYEVRLSGEPGSGSTGLVASGTVAAGTNSTTITGLQGSTRYSVYMRSECGAGGNSIWTTIPVDFTTEPGCGSEFTDSGGPSGNYGGGENKTTIICPDSANQAVRVVFSRFYVESNWDQLRVYEGLTPSFIYLGSFSGNLNANLPGGANGFTSTDPSGCFTFQFTSDASGNYEGWQAAVSCVPQCKIPTGMSLSEVQASSVRLNWGVSPGGAVPETFIYEVRTSAAAGSGPTGLIKRDTVDGSLSSTIINGLNGNTSYSVYLQSGCDTFNRSRWSAAYQFTTLPGCGSTFNDPAGVSQNYAANTDTTYVICPVNASDAVMVSFSMFRTQLNADKLYVYDGNSVNAPLFGTYSGAGVLLAPGAGEITANNTSGCLTFRFVSDASTNDMGWLATVTCLPKPSCIRPSGFSASDIDNKSARIKWTSPSGSTPIAYEYEIRTYGLPGSGSLGFVLSGSVNAPDTSAIVNGLLGNTKYKVYLRSKCAGDDFSLFTVAPFEFTTRPGCGSTFTDSGGPDAAYGNGENSVYTICPDNPNDSVRVTFGRFFVENSWDRLNIYNGPTTSSPSLGSYTGNLNANLPGGANGIVSTDTSGCLTFRFSSDGSGNYEGWYAVVSCNGFACSGTPDTAVLSVSEPLKYCGTAPAITLQLAEPITIADGVTTQWQSSKNGTTFSNIGGATTQNLLTPLSDSTTYYRLKTSCLVSGQTTYSDTVKIIVDPRPLVSLGTDTSLCDGDTLHFNVSNKDAAYLWNDQSTQATFSVFATGTYSVIVSDTVSGCIANDTIVVNRILPPDAGGIQTNGDAPSFTFSNTGGSDIATYLWDFGDGSTDSTATPSHTYTEDGTYNVQLFVSNECGWSDTARAQVVVSSVSIGSVGSKGLQTNLYPNPATNQVTVVSTGAKMTLLEVLDPLGRVVHKTQPQNNSTQIVTAEWAAGIYTVRIQTSLGFRVMLLQVNR